MAEAQLRTAPGAAVPVDRNLGDAVLADQCREGHLDRYVEMTGVERATVIDDLAPVRLECVGEIVEMGPEHQLNQFVGQAIAQPLDDRVVNNLCPRDKA